MTIRLLEIKANELFIKGWKYSQNRILEDLSTSNCFISKDMLANPVFDGASLFWRGHNFKSWLLTQKSCNLVNFISSDRLACRHENDTSGFSWNLSSASTNQYSPITTLKSMSQSQWTLDPLALVCAQNVSLGKYLLECWKFDKLTQVATPYQSWTNLVLLDTRRGWYISQFIVIVHKSFC